MSHIFISYSRKDINKREELVKYLESKGFKNDEIWFDNKSIEGGDEWRQTIDTALEEAFAVLVIITPNSLKSHYVTYEWGCAIGKGIFVIPLLFEDKERFLFIFKRMIKHTHPLQESRQNVNCRSQIPEAVIDRLSELKKQSPIANALNIQISILVMPLRILARFSVWLYQQSRDLRGTTEFHPFISKAADEARELYFNKLSKFSIDHSPSFTRKQKRYCEMLLEKINIFADKLGTLAFEAQFPYHSQEYLAKIDILIREVENYRVEDFEPLIKFFSRAHASYDVFDEYLGAPSHHELRKHLAFSMVNMTLGFLPEAEDARVIEEIIQRYTQN